MHYSKGTEAVIRLLIHWLLLLTVYFSGTRGYAAVLQHRAEEKEQIAKLRSAQEEEKLRIARELHDVLAHSLTLQKVQANAGIVASRNDAGAAVNTLQEIRTTAEGALQEVKNIVRALRGDGGAVVRPGTDIEGIIQGFRKAGLEIDVRITDGLEDSSELARLAIARMVAESLTNVVRHQGVNATAGVEVQRRGDVASVDIASRGTAQPGGSGVGMGLVGLEERARSLGGHLSAGGSAEYFRVHADIPAWGA